MIFKNKEYEAYYEKAFIRHQNDLADVKLGIKKNLKFNKALALSYIKIIEQLKHYKGELAGEKIKLELWQKKMISVAFGWQKLNNKEEWVRRFNTIFIFLPRKNGKTILASALGLADSIILGEIGGEVVIFATKNKQAKLAWNGIEKMIASNPDLRNATKNTYGVITLQTNDVSFSTLGRDSDTEDGLNVSFGIADEYHAHPDNSLFEVVKSSQGARKQPCMLVITTAGFNIQSPCYDMFEYAKNILEDKIQDDNFFAFIAKAENDDNVFAELTWAKANPNYGISLKKDYMQNTALEAENRPSLKNNFLVKNLNIWTNSSEEFISYSDWLSCAGEFVFDDNLPCVLGFDLSIADDFSALVKVQKQKDKYLIKAFHYVPKANIDKREKTLRVPLFTWARDKVIIATNGRAIDYDFIYEDIKKSLSTCEALVYDPYKAKYLIKKLEDEGFDNTISLRQGFLSLSSPTKFLLDLVKDKKIIHQNDPVLNWQVSNLAILKDASGNIKLDKAHENRKIDAFAALINALSYFEATSTEVDIYEERGMRVL